MPNRGDWPMKANSGGADWEKFNRISTATTTELSHMAAVAGELGP
jgi:hypothetical protein